MTDDPINLDAMLDEALDELDDENENFHPETQNSENHHRNQKSAPNPLVGRVSWAKILDETSPSKETATAESQVKKKIPFDSTSKGPMKTDHTARTVQNIIIEGLDATESSKNEDENITASQRIKSQRESKNECDTQEQPSQTSEEKKIASILGELGKVSINETEEQSAPKSATIPSLSTGSEEEKMLQEMFQSMANGGMLPAGLEDLWKDDHIMGSNDDDDDNVEFPSDFNPDAFMDGMMEQLLSKDFMYEPMKQVTEMFPAWLQAHKDQLSAEEWDKRNKQYRVFQELVQVYEEELEDESNKTGRLMELMQQVQEFGQPPPEIVKEIAPGLELDHDGLPKLDALPMFQPGEDGECLVM